MKISAWAAAAAVVMPSMAAAVGVDRSNQKVDLLFAEGNKFELSYGRVDPDVTGNDLAVFGGSASGEVADTFSQLGAGLKMDLNPRLSVAIITDEPYGADIDYPFGRSVALGGTRATLDSRAVTALARYKFNDAFSVHGGIRHQTIDPDVTLRGLAYGGLNADADMDGTARGYAAQMDSDGDVGFVIGMAYEIPEIALRVAVTYFSGTDHEFTTRETLDGIPVSAINPALGATSVTTLQAPRSLNIDFQTGVAQDTLVFGSIRYADFDDSQISPLFFDLALDGLNNGDPLTSLESGIAAEIGVGRRFNDRLAGSLTLGYDQVRDDELVSPLDPTNGNTSLGLGVSYDVTANFNVSVGARYVWIRDAFPETGTPDVARASFTDNDAKAFGVKFGYSF